MAGRGGFEPGPSGYIIFLTSFTCYPREFKLVCRDADMVNLEVLRGIPRVTSEHLGTVPWASTPQEESTALSSPSKVQEVPTKVVTKRSAIATLKRPAKETEVARKGARSPTRLRGGSRLGRQKKQQQPRFND
ncbi:hypothetical protein BHE74_00052495 [Ensete ventricosum]|nr:hypothetical protein GW17_00022561 [Ensete ventricosum]RWW41986.1 hypothetical protein BHE74_00052495 [Ensete ventricosum]RZR91596.1 hypothetical protein BHM03_00019740 [Ensete ventricosum]